MSETGVALPLSVAVPTRNGGTRVTEALASVRDQLEPGDELIVVDDGSTDDTANLVETWFSSSWPEGRVLRQEHRGISAARNTALESAGSEVVCFFDDDEFVGDGWLPNLRAAWLSLGPQVGAIGGPMRAIWPIPRPVWLDDDLLHVVSVLDLGDERLRLTQRPFTGYAWGGNFSIRTSAALQAGGFDPQLGYGPNRTLAASRGEEEEMQDRLAKDGWEVWYEPTAWIEHRIGAERLRPSAFRRVYRRAAQLDLQAGKSRTGGIESLLRSGAHVPRALIHPGRGELVRASFAFTYGYARLVGPA